MRQQQLTFLLLSILAVSPSLQQQEMLCYERGLCSSAITVGVQESFSYNSCLSLCQEHELCQWFTWMEDTNRCVKFMDCPTLDPTCDTCLVGHEDCVPRDKGSICMGKTVGGEFKTDSAAECQSMCQSNADCKWSSFVPDTNNCILTKDCDVTDDSCSNCVSSERLATGMTKLMVVGGSGAFNKVEVVDLSGHQLSCPPLADFPYTHGSAGEFVDGRALVCGGFREESRCYSYDPLSDSWVSDETMMYGRHYHAGVMLSPGEWWVTGGYSGLAYEYTELYRAGEGFVPHVKLPMGKMHHNLVKVNETHVMMVGGESSLSAWLFGVEDQVWTALPDMSVRRYAAHAGLVNGGAEVVVAGGANENSTEIFNLASNSWRMGPKLPVRELYGGSSVQIEDTFVIVGGETYQGAKSRSIYKFDAVAIDWIEMPEILTHHARTYFAAFLVPDDLVQCS